MSKKIRNKRDRFLKNREKQKERSLKKQYGSVHTRKKEEY